MKRPYEDIVESPKRKKEEEEYIMSAFVGQKRHQDENYDTQPSLKKPNLDIKLCKTGVFVYVGCSSVRFTNNYIIIMSRLVDEKVIDCGTLEILHRSIN